VIENMRREGFLSFNLRTQVLFREIDGGASRGPIAEVTIDVDDEYNRCRDREADADLARVNLVEP